MIRSCAVYSFSVAGPTVPATRTPVDMRVGGDTTSVHVVTLIVNRIAVSSYLFLNASNVTGPCTSTNEDDVVAVSDGANTRVPRVSRPRRANVPTTTHDDPNSCSATRSPWLTWTWPSTLTGCATCVPSNTTVAYGPAVSRSATVPRAVVNRSEEQ